MTIHTTTKPGLVLPDTGPGLVRHDSEPAIAAAALAFSVLSAGVSAAQEGDIEFNRPGDRIGAVVESGRPDWLRRGTRNKTLEIFRYNSGNPVAEAVNVKLQAICQWNGLEVDCTFQLPADGQRSRMMTDTKISIQNPVGLLEQEHSQAWKDHGYNSYPVVFVPVSIFVDEPWPNSNYKVTFQLVLSGRYGFGAQGYNVKHDYVAWED